MGNFTNHCMVVKGLLSVFLQVIFPDGVSTSTINLLIVADVDPELNEVTEVSLITITENGVPPGGDTARGARLIPSQILSVITVQANDAPHGVVVWSPPVVVAIENEGVDNTVELTLIREFGSIGAILISYRLATGPIHNEQSCI